MCSVSFADEIIVLDSGSTDATSSLASAMGAKVSTDADWQGFGVQKNRALALATSDWVLSIDADERVTPELKREIEAALNDCTFDAYCFSRMSSYCGKYIKHCGWYPDRVTRLFKRGKANFSNDLVHERLVIAGGVGVLGACLLHESYRNLEEVLDKTNRYSSAGAESKYKSGKRTSFKAAFGHGLWAFVRTYFLRLGFLDGRLGIVLSISIAEETYYRYLKLWMLQHPER